MALLRSITTVGGFTLGSRVLGFLRDVLIAALLGAGPVADAFFIAFRFPNMFRSLAAEGAFSVAFVPMFAGLVATRGRPAALGFAGQTLGVVLPTLLVFTLVVELAMPWLMYAIAPGFAATPAKFELAILLTRICFPYLMLISLVSLLGGMLNSIDRFAPLAAAPMLLNACLIVALFALTPLTPNAGHALAWGVAIAGVGEFLWLVIACRRAGLELRLPRPRLTPAVRQLLKRMLPAALGAGVIQVNVVVSGILASLLADGAVAILAYADRINQLPLGVFGAAIGTALLPLLSRHVRAGDLASAAHSQNRAIELALLLTVPAAAGLIALAHPIVSVLFERGAFGAREAAATGAVLAAYACGLPAYVLVKALAPAFFAREDTTTPVRIAIAAMLANLVLNLALMPVLAEVGLALGTALASWLNALLLALALRRRGHLALDERLRKRWPRVVLAALIMGGAVWAAGQWAAPWLAPGHITRYAALALLIGGGIVLFGLVAQVIGAARLRDLQALTRRNRS